MGAQHVLITGGAERIGGFLRKSLRRPGRTLRLGDTAPVSDIGEGEHAIPLDVTDPCSTAEAFRGIDAVVHLAALPHEAPFQDILAANVTGTHNVLHAAAEAGVSTVVFASSCHAAGWYARGEVPPGADGLPDDVPPRPDTYYGWSKAAGESMCALYHERYGIDITAIRIGCCFAEPPSGALADIWLAPVDAGRLVEACLAPRRPGFRVVWGVSANAGRWWSLAGSRALGYEPAEGTPAYPDAAPGDRVGDPFCAEPLGARMGRIERP